MNRKKGLLLGIALVMAMSLLFAGCTAAPAPATAPAAEATANEAATEATEAPAAADDVPYIIWVNPLVGSSVFTSADNGITAAAEKFGFKLKIIGPSVLDDTQMFEALQSAIVEKPDLIVTTPYNFTAISTLYAQAKEAGIPIIDISSDSGADSGRVCFIGTDNAAYGALAADYINQVKAGKANVLTMMANLDTSNQLQQREAFEAKCASDYPDIKTILVDADNADSVVSLEKFKDDLKAHPEIDTILCLEGFAGPSAALACEELGMTGKITILAIDDTADTLQKIRDGEIWGTMGQNFYKMGFMAGQLAMDYLSGTAVDSIYDSGTVLITADNVETYSYE